jgi:glycosyltransferase involved in cell wall biosynthesis
VAIRPFVDALLDDRNLAARLRRSAQGDACDRFTLEAMIENFERFYEGDRSRQAIEWRLDLASENRAARRF